jgi:hypothetical protein
MPHKIRNEPSSKLDGSDIQLNTAGTKDHIAKLIETIKSSPRVIGRKEYLKYLQSKKITRDEAIAAQCYVCMGYYRDGREDCKIETCPLYPFSPSRLYSPFQPLKTKEDVQKDK